MKFAFAVFALLSLSLTANAATCQKNDSKLIFESQSKLQDRVFVAGLKLCVAGRIIRIIGAEESFNSVSSKDYTAGLCKALGFGKRISYDRELLRKDEKLASFDSEGKLSGISDYISSPSPYDYAVYVASSVICEANP